MFDDISPSYDFLNHFLSLGIDIYWRKIFIRKLKIENDTKVLDVACGTGDVCFEIFETSFSFNNWIRPLIKYD